MKTALASFACWLLLLSGPVASAREDQPTLRSARLLEVPESARARVNPLAADPGALRAGQKLFERHCQECHGSTGSGGEKGASLRGPDVQGASAGSLFWVVTNGAVRSGMPVWSKLPEPQRWQIVTYVKSLGPP